MSTVVAHVELLFIAGSETMAPVSCVFLYSLIAIFSFHGAKVVIISHMAKVNEVKPFIGRRMDETLLHVLRDVLEELFEFLVADCFLICLVVDVGKY